MRRTGMFMVVLALGALPAAAPADTAIGLPELGYSVQGGTLSGTADYSWWYGCSPTSAGMVLGYYDRNGYGGLSYTNLVPGGTGEASTYPSTDGTWSYLAQYAIASPGNVHDFYRNGYGGSGDDLTTGLHSFDSLADFMGTSQDSVGNSNGSTTFWYWNNGKPFTAQDAIDTGKADRDGMYGIGEYITHAGYSVTSLYTELTDNVQRGHGFTFQQYKDEIDAGREVLIHVQGHSMTGIGYDANGNIILNDTWTTGPHSMAWGGSYEGLSLWGVTVFELAGGSPPGTIPAPGAVLLAGIGASLVGWLRRRKMLP